MVGSKPTTQRWTVEDLTGMVLNKRYQIESFVGSGGMAEVYKAKDVDAPHYYAIKVIREQLLEHPSLVMRFEDEAERLKNLQHPNIVRFYDFVASDGLTYIVMEYIDGYPLSHMLRLRRQREEGPMPTGEAVRILAQIARALARVHEQGLVHRDIKPGNILIRQTDGAAFLTDLGIAKDLTGGAVTHTLVGTFAYLAPEQIMRQPVSPATDIYALGTVAYYLFTGRRPFEMPPGAAYDTTEMEQMLIEQHLHRLPLPPSTHNHKLPPALDAAVGRALSKVPEARYPDAMSFMRAVHDALRAVLPGEMQVLKEIDAEVTSTPNVLRALQAPPRRTRRTTPTQRRRRERILGAGVLAIAALLVLVFALTRGAPPSRTATPGVVPNLTVTADWLTLEAERQALQSTETALAEALRPTETPSITSTSSPRPTDTFVPTPTATSTPTITSTNTATSTATLTVTQSPTRARTRAKPITPNLEMTREALGAIGTEAARTLAAASALPPFPAITVTATSVDTLNDPPGHATTEAPNMAVHAAIATQNAVHAATTRLARTLDASRPTASPTLTASSTPTPSPTSAVLAWCDAVAALQDAFGLRDDLSQVDINEEALQSYLAAREGAPLDPETGRVPVCMEDIDAWLYPRLIEATQAYFGVIYAHSTDVSSVGTIGPDIERARRYLDYASTLRPDDPAAPTLRQCVNLLDLIADPISMRDTINALRAQDADLALCEPTLSAMWDAALNLFPEISRRPIATVRRRDYLYEVPGQNRTGILSAGVRVAILGQTGAINGEYWFLVSLENGQRGYLLRDALEWEDAPPDLVDVPTVVPPPRAP